MKKLALVIAVMGLGCVSGEVAEPEGAGYSLAASERTVNETGVVGWQVDNMRALGRDGGGKVLLDLTMGKMLSVAVPERLQVVPGGQLPERTGLLVAALVRDMEGGRPPTVIDGNEVLAAPAPSPAPGDPGTPKECEEARWDCLNAMIACLNPLSGCRADGPICCAYADLICRVADQICKRGRR